MKRWTHRSFFPKIQMKKLDRKKNPCHALWAISLKEKQFMCMGNLMLPTYFRASGQIYDLLNFNLHFLLMELLLKLTATIQESGKLTHLIDKLALLNICSFTSQLFSLLYTSLIRKIKQKQTNIYRCYKWHKCILINVVSMDIT